MILLCYNTCILSEEQAFVPIFSILLVCYWVYMDNYYKVLLASLRIEESKKQS